MSVIMTIDEVRQAGSNDFIATIVDDATATTSSKQLVPRNIY